MKFNHLAKTFPAFVFGLTMAATTNGADLFQAGAHVDLGDGLRSTSITKTFDADLDDVYGSAGYLFPNTDTAPPANSGGSRGALGTGTLTSLPSYISSIVAASNREGYGSYGYRQIDDPGQPIAPTVSNRTSGIAGENGNTGINTVVPLYNVTLSSNPGDLPSDGFRMGVVVQQISGQDFPEQLRVTSSTGDSKSIAVSTSLSDTSLYFVDVLNPTAGETLSVHVGNLAAAGKGTQKAYIGGLTFDSHIADVSPAPYGEGYVWNRAADHSPGLTGGQTAGNPIVDANGNAAWSYETVVDSDNDGLVGGNPWYEASTSLMSWDNQWFSSTTTGRWATGDDLPASIGATTLEHTLDHALGNDNLPLVRWTNPTRDTASVDITGELAPLWGRSSMDDIEFVLASVEDATGDISVLESLVIQFGDGPVTIDLQDIELAASDQIIYGIRSNGTTGYVSLNDSDLSITLNSAAVPEPASVALWLLAGILGLGYTVTRRRHDGSTRRLLR